MTRERILELLGEWEGIPFTREAAHGDNWRGRPYVAWNTNPGLGPNARKVIYLIDCTDNYVTLYTNRHWTEVLGNMWKGKGQTPTDSTFEARWEDGLPGIVKDVGENEEAAVKTLVELFITYDAKLKNRAHLYEDQ